MMIDFDMPTRPWRTLNLLFRHERHAVEGRPLNTMDGFVLCWLRSAQLVPDQVNVVFGLVQVVLPQASMKYHGNL